MDSIIKDYLSGLVFGPVQQFERMAVVPLSATASGPVYLTLAEAHAKGVLTVSEVSEGGSVPELRVENRGAKAVLLLDGEELAGAKQNRVLNTTVLVRRNSSAVIPVSCTEQGRWSYSSPAFVDSGHVMSPRMRSTKARSVSASLETRRTFQSDQLRVWEEIDQLHRRAGTDSPTRAMRDLHEARRGNLDQYLGAFAQSPEQTGILVFLNGRVIGFDLLSRPEAFAQIGPKLIRSYAVEALVGETAKGPKPTVAAAEGFVAVAMATGQKKYKSVGLGHDYRFESAAVVGSALMYRKQVIHAAFFAAEADERTGRMMGPRWRSRRRGPSDPTTMS